MFRGIVREEKRVERITRFLTHSIRKRKRKRKLKARNSLLHRAKAQGPQDGRAQRPLPGDINAREKRKSQARSVTNDAMTAKTRCRGARGYQYHDHAVECECSRISIGIKVGVSRKGLRGEGRGECFALFGKGCGCQASTKVRMAGRMKGRYLSLKYFTLR